MQARLLLEDGTVFTGKQFGSEREAVGEIVFHTSMTGYQEVLTDSSCCGQIVTMTYPLIGNYGITRDDFEAVRPAIHGLVVRQYEEVPSNWRAEYTIHDLMKQYDVPGISQIDTRMLTRKIRQQGVMKSLITSSDERVEVLMERLMAASIPRNEVSRVSTNKIYSAPGSGLRIVLIDYGTKSGMLRDLIRRDCDVVVVPYNTTFEEIRHVRPDGILLSDGPGDPQDVPEAVNTIQALLQEYPVFGIGLGHQLFALACGAKIDKLKFGHRGGNHPVKDLASGRCFITSQNHSYSVVESSLASTKLEITHVNNNDKTIEGLRHLEYPAFSVQYDPASAPGPTESSYLFDHFLELIIQDKQERPSLPRQMQMMAMSKGAR